MTAEPLVAGTEIGRFVVDGLLARGGMGAIYRAHDPTLRRAVALKLWQVGRALPGDAHERMLREARALAALEHPNVVTVYDAGIHAGEVFIAMELIEGASLDRWLAARRRRWREIAAVLAQVGRGLAAAHAAGLVHRDVKPANVMIADDGAVKVVDFGLVRAVGELSTAASAIQLRLASPHLPGDPRLTQTGALVGTPAYAAPEQLTDDPVDVPSDVFGFCVTCCEAAFGRRPYAAPTAAALLARMQDARGPDLPRARWIPARLRALLRRGLALDPAARPPLAALVDELAREPLRRRRRTVGAVTGLLALAAAAATLGLRPAGDPPCTGAGAALAEVWNPARRVQLHAALVGTGAPFAAETWPGVAGALDGYATRWTAMHVETCRATAVHHTQSPQLLDRRMACLDSRRDALAAAVATLATADRAAAREALTVATGMPSLAACADARALLAVAPPPALPTVAAQVAIARKQLAAAEAMRRAGRYVDAVPATRAIAATADRLRDPQLRAEAHLALAHALDGTEAPDTRGALEQAVWLAAAAGDAGIEARALAALAQRERFGSVDALAAYEHARHALAILGRLAPDPVLEAEVLLANARVRAGIDHAEAMAHLARARNRLATTPGPAAEVVRIELDTLAALSEPTAGSALPALTAVLDRAEALYGRHHPALGPLLENLTHFAALAGQLDAARGYATRLSDLLRGLPGHTAALLQIEALVERDPARKVALLERAVAARTAQPGPPSPELAGMHSSLADALLAAGRTREAAPHIDRAVAIWDRAFAGRSEMLIVGLTTQAQIHLELGDSERAGAAVSRALAIADRTSTRGVTRTLAGLMAGAVYFEQRRFTDARTQFATHGPEARVLLGAEEPSLALVDFYLAASEYETGVDRPAALRRARDAAARARLIPDLPATELAPIRRWLSAH